jgi:hypothetical protein
VIDNTEGVREPRYVEGLSWFKGNTHIHSIVSDGGWTFRQLEDAYGGMGFDFLFRTDHWVASRATEESAGSNGSLLWLDGIELDGFDQTGSYYHVVCLGAFNGIEREMGFAAALAAARDQGGLLILAHPFWTGNSFGEAKRWGFHGVELYNHVCQWLNGKGDARPYWHAMLADAPRTLGFASDDAHTSSSHPGWNGGWVVVQARSKTPSAIMESLRLGRFYSSTGPEFRSIVCRAGEVIAETSPIQFARLVGPKSVGRRIGSFDGALIDRISFEVPPEWPYAYIEIEDSCGRRAWTNTLQTGCEEE